MKGKKGKEEEKKRGKEEEKKRGKEKRKWDQVRFKEGERNIGKKTKKGGYLGGGEGWLRGLTNRKIL